MRRNLSVVALAKDESQYLWEWLEFHRLVGVQHVFLYDDGSSDNTLEIVHPYTSSGFVTFIPWSRLHEASSTQELAYAHALSTFGAEWRWMAFIDIDEFLFPTKADSLVSALSKYDDLPAIAVPWLMFGFCGHKQCQPGLVIENYTKRAPFPPQPGNARLLKWKSIVDPLRVYGIWGAHFFLLEDGKHGAYDENRIWLTAPAAYETFKSVPSCEIFRLNHYFTKSEEEFGCKLQRQNPGARNPSISAGNFRSRTEILACLIEMESIEDQVIQRFLPELRKLRTAFEGGGATE